MNLIKTNKPIGFGKHRTDNSAKHNPANMKFRQFSGKYIEDSVRDKSATFKNARIARKKSELEIGVISQFRVCANQVTSGGALFRLLTSLKFESTGTLCWQARKMCGCGGHY